jgi:hypothetical protein
MSALPPSPATPRDGGRLPDDLDGLLRAFYRAEMPDPWPVLEPPAAAGVAGGPPAPGRRPLARSRLALAATVSFLLIGELRACERIGMVVAPE